MTCNQPAACRSALLLLVCLLPLHSHCTRILHIMHAGSHHLPHNGGQWLPAVSAHLHIHSLSKSRQHGQLQQPHHLQLAGSCCPPGPAPPPARSSVPAPPDSNNVRAACILSAGHQHQRLWHVWRRQFSSIRHHTTLSRHYCLGGGGSTITTSNSSSNAAGSTRPSSCRITAIRNPFFSFPMEERPDWAAVVRR